MNLLLHTYICLYIPILVYINIHAYYTYIYLYVFSLHDVCIHYTCMYNVHSIYTLYAQTYIINIFSTYT